MDAERNKRNKKDIEFKQINDNYEIKKIFINNNIYKKININNVVYYISQENKLYNEKHNLCGYIIEK